jgi:2-polyprenyl-3-methyl-5-hydroxy-6-metoxy-1,4-benzoquinol methylase
MVGTGDAPVDWYLSSFAANFDSLYWEEGAHEKVELACAILALEGHEVILDLACATGRRTHELRRLGFDVAGADPRPELLEIAGGEAEIEGLEIGFFEIDTRELEFDGQFDVVLSLGGGAFEHYERDQQCFEAFEAAARALRRGGRLLMQIPNVLHVERHLPPRTWLRSPNATEVIQQFWNAPTHRLDGTRRSLIDCEAPEDMEPFDFQRRLYTIEELGEIFELVGLRLSDVYDEKGCPWGAGEDEQQLFVEARR